MEFITELQHHFTCFRDKSLSMREFGKCLIHERVLDTWWEVSKCLRWL